MKSLTEFGGVQIRMAASAIAEARRSLPAEEPVQAPEPAAAEPAPVEAAEQAGQPGAAPASEDSPAAADATASADVTAAAPEAAPAPTPKPAADGESESVKAALDAAVASATGLSGDRLAMLRAAVEVVGKRAADVRVVRVFGSEEPVPGAKSVGGHQYVVDFLPASMKQVAGSPKEERGGRRGGGKGGGRGGGGAGRGGAPGAGATGGFSMDSLRDDRKNERGGGRPGGGRRPGGAPRGAPKK